MSLAWEPSTDNVGVAFYYVYFDRVRAQVSETTYTAANLECGRSIKVWIVAVDLSLNRSESAPATVSTAPCDDMQAPTPPTGFVQAATSEDAVVLAWKASSDDVGVTGYGIYRDQLLVGSTSVPSADLTGLACGSSYEYQVDAVDAAGNRSERRSAWIETSACPTTPPPAPSSGWTFCAMEYEQCTFPGTKEVRYGYAGTFTEPRVFSNTVPCTNGIFGDPCPVRTSTVSIGASAGVRRLLPRTTHPRRPRRTRRPPPPADLAVESVTQTSVTLTWSAATDDVAVTGYDVYRNGTKVASVTDKSYLQGGLVCDSSNWFGVEALDAAGNRSERTRVQATTAACSPSPSTGWTFCADEHEQCTFSGTKEVRYGYEATFTAPRVFSNTVSCSNAIFGDPVPGALKHCEYRDLGGETPPPSDAPPADTTAPSQPANLAVSSVTTSSVTLTWNASTDNVGVTGYRVYVNGNGVADPASPGATVSALACGTAFTFEVDASDAAGNRSTRARITASTAACGDSQPPSAPANVAASSRTATSIALTWSAATDNVGVTGYGLYRAGTLVGSSSTTSGLFTGLSCNTNYTLSVDAYDAAANRSQKTTVLVSTTACIDSTPPSAPRVFRPRT